ncbi:NAD(P)/FAD-dependent oxidoreductase, partial [Chloroflexota bacterium]
EQTLEVDGVFVSIGFLPNTEYLKGVVPLDERGSITVNENMETGIPGIFAAGDICRKSIWQVVVACGDGAVAAVSAERYLGH